MKKVISRLLVFFMAIVSVSALTACGKRDGCYVTLPTSLPEGVESVTCNATYTNEDGETKAGTAYEGSYTITIMFEEGWENNNLELMIGSKSATEHDYYIETVKVDNQIDYKFEGVKKSLTFSLAGTAKKIDYSVTHTLNMVGDTMSQNFRSANFRYITYISGEKTESNILTGNEFKNSYLTGEAKTMHHGNIIKIEAWNPVAKRTAYTDFVGFDGEKDVEYFVDVDGTIKTIVTMKITGNADIKIYESNIDYVDSPVSANICSNDEVLNNATGIYFSNSVLVGDGNPILSNFTAGETYNIEATLGDDIHSYVLQNYSSSQLSFKVNGTVIDKENISCSGKFVITGLKNPYEYVSADGYTSYYPAMYTIEIIGVQEFLAEKVTSLNGIVVGVAETSLNQYGTEIKTPTIGGYYLKGNDLTIDIVIEGTINPFNVTATKANGETIILADVHAIEGDTVVSGVNIHNESADGKTNWRLTFTADSNITNVTIG